MKINHPIARLFGKSPFGPLQEHMHTVERCAQELLPLLSALADDDMESVRRHKDRVFELEHEADEIKDQIRSALPMSLLMPVARRDLLDLLSTQDAVADAAQDAAGLLGMGKLRVVPALRAPLLDFAREVIGVAGLARELIDRLDELVEVGFRGREADRILTMITAVSAAETVTDTMGSALVQILFDSEVEMGPLSVVFWYEVIQNLGRVADESENVGDRLRLLIAQ